MGIFDKSLKLAHNLLPASNKHYSKMDCWVKWIQIKLIENQKRSFLNLKKYKIIFFLFSSRNSNPFNKLLLQEDKQD